MPAERTRDPATAVNPDAPWPCTESDERPDVGALVPAGWGGPCHPDLVRITIGAAGLAVARGAAPAFEAWRDIAAGHNYPLRPAFPAGDTGVFNCRKIAGTDVWSNHAYAIALDANWRDNPFGAPLRYDYPDPMITQIEALRCTDGAPVFGWGGRWRIPDAMHWEIACSAASIAGGIVDSTPGDDVATTNRVQRELRDHFGYPGRIDGKWGPQTQAAWLRQKRWNNRLPADGGLTVASVFRQLAADLGHDPGQTVDRADADRVVQLASRKLGVPFPGVPGAVADPADNALVAVARMLGFDPGQRCGPRCLRTIADDARWHRT